MHKKHYKRGFSLVELSIVLVILGLLTGGILAGQSLIRAAELRSISSDYQRYMVAVQSFRDKYFTIPGDMTNATAFWGVLAGTGSDIPCHASTLISGTLTCNGDGDGTMWLTLNGTSSMNYENFRFWQHLSNAGLIEGYSGRTSPPSKIANAYFYPIYGLGVVPGGTTYNAGSSAVFAGDYGKNMMTFGQMAATSCGTGGCPLLPEETWNIDTKMDDGLPGMGRILANKGRTTGPTALQNYCTTAAGVAPPADAGATYSLNVTTKDCMLFFTRAF